MIQKEAQKKRLLNKLREMSNISGVAAEKYFDPEFKKVMVSLRNKDNQIRAIVSGEMIKASDKGEPDGDPGDDPISLKALLKSANSNLRRREYMQAVSDLGRFHHKIGEIVQIIGQLNTDVDQVHHEFLFKDLKDEQKKYLSELKKRLAERHSEQLKKEAGIMDFLVNIGTQRGRALSAWEKKYPKQVGKLKSETHKLLSKSEHLLSTILSSLKDMAAARAGRNVDDYVKATDKISKGYSGYNSFFKEYYQNNIKNFLDKVDFLSDQPEEKKPEAIAPVQPVPAQQEISKQEVKVEPKAETTIKSVEPSVTPGETEKESEFSSDILADEIYRKLGLPAKVAPPAPTVIDETLHETEKAPVEPRKPQKFIKDLEAMENENPIILAKVIKRYAKSIESSDPSLAIQLFKLAQNITC